MQVPLGGAARRDPKLILGVYLPRLFASYRHLYNSPLVLGPGLPPYYQIPTANKDTEIFRRMISHRDAWESWDQS